MATNDREYSSSSSLPNWLKNFADERLEKGGNTFEDIKELFKSKSEFDSVEARVKELRDMVGIDSLEKVASGEKDEIPGGYADNKSDEKYDKEQLGKGIGVEMEHTDDWEVAKEISKDHLEESKDFKDGKGGKYYDKLLENEKKIEEETGHKKRKAFRIRQLIVLANELEAEGNIEAAMEIDKQIYRLAKENKTPEIFKKHPKLEIFINNVCRTRGGHVEVPAIQNMIRNERPEDIDVSNKELVEYIKKCLKEHKNKIPDEGDEHAGEYVAIDKMMMMMATQKYSMNHQPIYNGN